MCASVHMHVFDAGLAIAAVLSLMSCVGFNVVVWICNRFH